MCSHTCPPCVRSIQSRQYADENGEARRRALGGHAPALTVIIAGIYDEAWLLEIEAVAAE